MYDLTETSIKPGRDCVVQFSIFASNRVGSLNDILNTLKDIHIMAISIVDTTENVVVRTVVDCPETAKELLVKKNIPFIESEVLAVELEREDQLRIVTCALVQTEINIHYLYPFLIRPYNKTGLIMSLENNSLAKEVLEKHEISVLKQSDISR